MLLGTYEKACKPWSPVDTPWDFGHELLPPDLDRIAPSLEVGFRHFPAHREGRHQAGDQRPLHLRAGRQPAGRPGAGPHQFLGRLRASWPASARAAASGWRCPTGWSTAIPASTSGAWTSRASANGRRLRYTNAKVRENYSRRFSIRFPNEELPAARPAADDAALRHDGRAERRDGRFLGAGDAAVVRAEGRRAEGHRLLPPLQRFRACRRRGARGARTASASPRSPTSPSTRSPGRARRTSSTG